jgi:chaperonin GroES
VTPAELRTARLSPLNDRVLVRPVTPDQATEGGLVIPDTVQQELPGLGTIVAVSPELTVLVGLGDIVTFARHAGTPATVQGEDLLLVRAGDILGVYHQELATTHAEGLDG